MHIYDFVNSKDMRDYLQEIQYQFTALEAASIVYLCEKATLDQKIKAWQEIINTMPDRPIPEGLDPRTKQFGSIHSLLKSYITSQKRKIENFSLGDGCIYTYNIYAEQLFFEEYTSCVNSYEKEKCTRDFPSSWISKYLLHKSENIEKYSEVGSICFNDKMEIMDIYEKTHMDEHFIRDVFYMFYNIPTPFKRGDILVNYRVHVDAISYRPFVLSYMITWDSKEMLRRGFKRCEYPHPMGCSVKEWDRILKNKLKNGTPENRWEEGVCINKQDNKDNLERVFFMTRHIDLEYYRGTLEGFERQLQVYSCYEKNEISAEFLTDSCFAIRFEEYSKRNREVCDRKEFMKNVTVQHPL